VKQYWLVDPQLRTFEIWKLSPRRRYTRFASVTEGTIPRIPGLAGLKVDVDALWAELDRLISSA
jgi:Uma2 family endonuclease